MTNFVTTVLVNGNKNVNVKKQNKTKTYKEKRHYTMVSNEQKIGRGCAFGV